MGGMGGARSPPHPHHCQLRKIGVEEKETVGEKIDKK